MEKVFWLEKWRNNEIGFHNREVHPLLVQHVPCLNLSQGDRLFLPLCGKTLDIAWLLEKGYRVAGAELSESAVIQLFDQLAINPRVTDLGALKKYHSDDVEMFVGDIFDLTGSALGPVDAIYDRAALVALPAHTRQTYTQQLHNLTASARQLLISFEYDQARLAGPPFCVNGEEIRQLYADGYTIELLSSVAVAGGLKGQVAAMEQVWHLQPR
ncbi:thiopurine S-methyltransferase [Microbulbifer elongatus]|uniref:thiopurine S-methyltransferase n=1 Tax=Microbulbifer elongatus TaxID=86173 RepID=UPI001E5B21FB|nr:thiopurine S-methyltransferase [Microbulbifer elongatus]